MSRRLPSLAALVGLLVLSPAARAGGEKPILVGVVKPIDGLLADMRFVAGALNKSAEWQTIEGALDGLRRNTNLGGFDTSKPIAFYVRFDPGKEVRGEFTLLVPVVDEKQALKSVQGALDMGKFACEKAGNGLWKTEVPGTSEPAYFGFHNHCLCVSIGRGPGALARGRVLSLNEVVPKAPSTSVVSLRLSFDAVPANLKAELIRGFQKAFAAELLDTPSAEPPAVRKFIEVAVGTVADLVKLVVSQGQDLTFRLDIDRQGQDLSASLSFRGRPGTDLAQGLKGLGEQGSLAAGLAGPASRMTLGLNLALPEKLSSALADLLPLGFEQIAGKLRLGDDPAQRRLARAVLRAARPTIKAGRVDGAIGVRGPGRGGLHTMVAGLMVKNGREMEDLFRRELQGNGSAKLDVDKVGKVAIHRLPPGLDDLGEDATALLGQDPPGYIAFREDAVLLAAGQDGLKAIGQAVTARPRPGPLVQVDMSCAFLATFALPGGREQTANAVAVARRVFKDRNRDRLRITLEGGESLRLRVGLDAQALRFFAELEDPRQGVPGRPPLDSRR
jgi:hypothetical protein